MARTDKQQERIGRFRDMNANELQLQERELAEQVFRLRFAMNTGQGEGLKRLREARRQLARVKTIMREQEMRKV